MTREEMGSYLGMKLETVSRAFSHLQDQGLISIKVRQVKLEQIADLKASLASEGAASKPKDHGSIVYDRRSKPRN